MLLAPTDDLLLFIIVDGCHREENNLASITELLIDSLTDQQDAESRKSIWKSIIDSEKVRLTIWKQVCLFKNKSFHK